MEKRKKVKAGKDYIGLGGGVLIINDKKETLLLKRSINSKNEPLWWSKPGGSIDYGEKAIDMAKREILEELGVSLNIIGLLPHTDHIIKKENQHWVAINFIGKIKKGTARIMEHEKCDEIKWFPLNNLPRKTNKTTRESAKYFLEGKYINI